MHSIQKVLQWKLKLRDRLWFDPGEALEADKKLKKIYCFTSWVVTDRLHQSHWLTWVIVNFESWDNEITWWCPRTCWQKKADVFETYMSSLDIYSSNGTHTHSIHTQIFYFKDAQIVLFWLHIFEPRKKLGNVKSLNLYSISITASMSYWKI